MLVYCWPMDAALPPPPPPPPQRKQNSSRGSHAQRLAPQATRPTPIVSRLSSKFINHLNVFTNSPLSPKYSYPLSSLRPIIGRSGLSFRHGTQIVVNPRVLAAYSTMLNSGS